MWTRLQRSTGLSKSLPSASSIPGPRIARTPSRPGRLRASARPSNRTPSPSTPAPAIRRVAASNRISEGPLYRVTPSSVNPIVRPPRPGPRRFFDSAVGSCDLRPFGPDRALGRIRRQRPRRLDPRSRMSSPATRGMISEDRGESTTHSQIFVFSGNEPSAFLFRCPWLTTRRPATFAPILRAAALAMMAQARR